MASTALSANLIAQILSELKPSIDMFSISINFLGNSDCKDGYSREQVCHSLIQYRDWGCRVHGTLECILESIAHAEAHTPGGRGESLHCTTYSETSHCTTTVSSTVNVNYLVVHTGLTFPRVSTRRQWSSCFEGRILPVEPSGPVGARKIW